MSLTPLDITKLTDIMREVFVPRMEEMVRQEVEGRVRQEAYRLLSNITGQEIRELVRKEVQGRVEVEVRVTP